MLYSEINSDENDEHVNDNFYYAVIRVVCSRHLIMYHVEGLSVELEDSRFDQMLQHSMMDCLTR